MSFRRNVLQPRPCGLKGWVPFSLNLAAGTERESPSKVVFGYLESAMEDSRLLGSLQVEEAGRREGRLWE